MNHETTEPISWRTPQFQPSQLFDSKEQLLLKLELLKKVDFFRPLPDSTLKLIAKQSRNIFLEKGQFLIKEGEHEDNIKFFIILSGVIQIFKGLKIKKLVSLLGPGECVGEMAMIDNEPRSASALALKDTVAMEIDEKIFKEHLADNPRVLREMLRMFSHRMRNSLKMMNEDLKQISNLTHDMRNCLVPLGLAETLLSNMLKILNGTSDKHQKRQGGDIVQKSYDTMLAVKNNVITLIDQSLACAKKEKSEYIKVDLPLWPLIKETVDEISCHKYLKGKKVIVKKKNEELKNGFGNSLDIKRVLQNLVINAGYVTKKDDPIEIFIEDLDGFNVVTVKDYGDGIPEDIQSVLLKENFTSKPDGNGFGLMSCRDIIEEYHKGKIWFETEIGKGTAFSFTVPHCVFKE